VWETNILKAKRTQQTAVITMKKRVKYVHNSRKRVSKLKLRKGRGTARQRIEAGRKFFNCYDA